jgi:aminoglycoside 2''-phosphotransferase
MKHQNNIFTYKEAIRKNFPQLEINHIELDLSGWDNVVVLVNHEIVFRFPRRPDAARQLEIETRLLPELRKYVTLTIPYPEFLAHGLVGYRLIPGEPLTKELFRKVCSPKVIRNLAHQLGEFLSELHSFPPKRAIELGVPHVSDQKLWADFYEEIQRKVFPLLSPNEREWTEHLFESFLSDERNFSFKPVLLHGDLCSDHILFDQKSKRITGIIDFGDVRIGDSAYDFQPYEFLLQNEYGEKFWRELLAHYSLPVDESFFRRLEFYAQRWPFHEILYGLDCGFPGRVASGLEALRGIICARGRRV